MTRGTVQHDVAQLLDKYMINDILDVILEIASEHTVDVMKKWFTQKFYVKRDIGDDIDSDAIKTISQDIENIRMRLARLERGGTLDDMQTTGNVPKEIVDAISDWKKYRKDDKLK